MASSIPPIYIFQIIVGVVGILGNCLVCVVIWRTPAMHTLTNAFIFNQATVDFLGSIFMFLFSVVPIPEILPPGTAGVLLCRVWIAQYFLWACYITSSFNLVALTFERYLAIVYPFKFHQVCHRLGATIVIVFVWVAGFSTALYASEIFRYREGRCVNFFDEKLRVVGIMIPGFQYFFPVVSMLVAYIHITVELKRSANRLARIMGPSAAAAGAGTSGGGAPESAEESLLRARRNTFKTLLIVFIAYVTCWTLNSSLLLASTLGFPSDETRLIISIALVAANSAINPIIYALKYKQFQKGLRKLFSCKGEGDNEVRPSTIVTQLPVGDTDV